jgi:hypothetical protein
MVYRVSTHFLDHGLSFWKKLDFHLKKPWSITRKSQINGLRTLFLCFKVFTFAQFF